MKYQEEANTRIYRGKIRIISGKLTCKRICFLKIRRATEEYPYICNLPSTDLLTMTIPDKPNSKNQKWDFLKTFKKIIIFVPKLNRGAFFKIGKIFPDYPLCKNNYFFYPHDSL